MKPVIKVCGITRSEDAAFCVEAGADWLGFIFHAGSPRCVEPQLVAGFDTGRARRVGVFVSQSPVEILDIMEKANLQLAQLHGGQDAEFCRAVGPEKVIRTMWPQKYESSGDFNREMDKLKDAVSYFLFDAGKSGGGHGQSFDLGLIREIAPPRSWLLAGGLTAERAAGLMTSSLPVLSNLAGFDFNSGVEKAPGIKDPFLVEFTISGVSAASESLEAARAAASKAQQ